MLSRPRQRAYEKIAKIIEETYGSEILCSFIEQPLKNGWVTIYAMNKETREFLYHRTKRMNALITASYVPINKNDG
jgi:hypothetical protein